MLVAGVAIGHHAKIIIIRINYNPAINEMYVHMDIIRQGMGNNLENKQGLTTL